MDKLIKDIKINIHNKFDIEVIDSITGKVKQRVKAENIVCNQLFSKITVRDNMPVSDYAKYVVYGSGSGIPSVADTALFNHQGGVSTTRELYENDVINKVASRVYKAILDINTGNGITITEIGLSSSTATGNLATHAMLPVPITKTDTDVINIYATVYCHYQAGRGIQIFPQESMGYQYWTSAILGWGNPQYTDEGGVWSRWAITKNSLEHHAIGYGNSSVITPSITKPNDRTITITLPRIPPEKGNINGIKRVISNRYYDSSTFYSSSYSFPAEGYSDCIIEMGSDSWGAFQITNESIGTGDGTTTKFKTAFDLPFDATIYVNGSVASDVTVKRLPSNSYPSEMFTQIHKDSTLNNLIPVDFCAQVGTGDNHTATGYFRNKDCVIYENIGSSYGERMTNNFTGKISNDLITWVNVNGALTSEQQAYRFFKSTASNAQQMATSYDGYNIVFDTPPASGAVITATYKTSVIPKDIDHAVDIVVTVQLGTY